MSKKTRVCYMRGKPRRQYTRKYFTMFIYNLKYRILDKEDNEPTGWQQSRTIIARNQKEAKFKLNQMLMVNGRKRLHQVDSIERWFDDVDIKDIRGIPRG